MLYSTMISLIDSSAALESNLDSKESFNCDNSFGVSDLAQLSVKLKQKKQKKSKR